MHTSDTLHLALLISDGAVVAQAESTESGEHAQGQVIAMWLRALVAADPATGAALTRDNGLSTSLMRRAADGEPAAALVFGGWALRWLLLDDYDLDLHTLRIRIPEPIQMTLAAA